MKVEQIYTGCLAEAAYYIESDGEAAIVDPLRETRPYIEKAERNDAKIKYILETHFHADFVSGHIDLSKKTGGKIVFGPTATPGYDAYVAKDGEELKLGNVKIKVLHTPGHTMESTTYLLIDENGKANSIFTGDTLFIGDVGRPDLVQKLKAEITPQILAGYLYDSLRNKIMSLPDDVIVYPGHGAGSACGKNMSKETTDTLGHQKKVNYALQPDMSKDEFIRAVTEGLVEPPQYFPLNVLMNVKGGIESIDDVIRKGNRPLTANELQTVWESMDALVLDTRSKEAFLEEHIPGSIFIGLDDHFAPWVGTLVTNLKQTILFVAEEGREEEVVIRLSRVGYDNTSGYLEGGMNAWKEAGFETNKIDTISAESFASKYEKGREHINLLDARRRSEYDSEHIVGAEDFPLDFINRNMSQLDRNKKYYVYCAGGYRSAIMCSILKARGYENLVNILGGYKALSQTNLQKTIFREPVTML
jgi:hydroxyacylglutathione hydrolase